MTSMGERISHREEIADKSLKYLIAGWFWGAVQLDEFPIKVQEVRHNVPTVEEGGDGETVESFTIVTYSGLKYTVRVDFDGYDDEEAEA